MTGAVKRLKSYFKDISADCLAAALERADKPIAVPRGFRADAAEHLAELRRYLEN